MPCRNAATTLDVQLASLAAQDCSVRWEVVLVDNGSTDATRAVADAYRTRVPLLSVVDSSPRGRGAACNSGVAAAVGRWIVFLDADDEVEPGYLDAMASALDDWPFVAARLDCRTLNADWVQASRSPAQTTGLGDGLFPYGYGASLAIDRRLFTDLGGFDTTLPAGEDVDLCYRAALAGNPVRFVPGAVLRYRYRDTMRGIWEQAFRYGWSGPLLYRKYRANGDSRPSFRTAARSWAGALRQLARARSRADLGRACYLVAHRIGRVRGAIAARVVYW